MNEDSFETAKEWVRASKENIRDDVAILLIANKADIAIDKHKVKIDDAK